MEEFALIKLRANLNRINQALALMSDIKAVVAIRLAMILFRQRAKH